MTRGGPSGNHTPWRGGIRDCVVNKVANFNATGLPLKESLEGKGEHFPSGSSQKRTFPLLHHLSFMLPPLIAVLAVFATHALANPDGASNTFKPSTTRSNTRTCPPDKIGVCVAQPKNEACSFVCNPTCKPKCPAGSRPIVVQCATVCLKMPKRRKGRVSCGKGFKQFTCLDKKNDTMPEASCACPEPDIDDTVPVEDDKLGDGHDPNMGEWENDCRDGSCANQNQGNGIVESSDASMDDLNLLNVSVMLAVLALVCLALQ